MKLLLSISFFLFSFINCFSGFEPGYIISNENDTTIGLIKVQNETEFAVHCFFKKDINDKAREYFPYQIKGYRFINGKYFISSNVELNGEIKKVFLEWLIKGKLNMLAYNNSLKDIRYFMQIRDSSMIELKNTKKTVKTKYVDKYTFTNDTSSSEGRDYIVEKKEYIGTLNYCLQDWPKIKPELSGLSLNRNALISIAKDYHNYSCPNEECIIFEGSKWAPVLSVGVAIGYNLTNVQTPYPSHIETSKNFPIGLLLNFSKLPLVSKNLSLEADMFYLDQQYNYDKNLIKQYYPPVSGSLFELQQLRIPIFLKYKFPINQISPFIGGGATINYRKSTITGMEYLINKVIDGVWPMDEIFASYQVGWNLQIGFSVNIMPEISVEYSFCYERMHQFFGGFNDDNSHNTNIVNTVGISYRFIK